MKRLSVLTLAFLLLTAFAVTTFSQYTVTELPAFAGGGASLAQRINDRGQIVGEAFLFEGPPHAAMWYRGEVTDLGTLGGVASTATDINNRGQVTGYSQIASGATRSFLWRDGTMVNIGTLGTAATFAFGINQRGEIAGFARSGGATSPFHAFVWRNGSFTDLGTLGGNESFAYDINEKGCVVGESEIDVNAPGLTHAFRWCDGVMTDLGTLGGPVSAANGINEHGQIVGISMTATFEFRAFLWDKGEMVELATLPGGHFSGSVGINARGQMVGINSSDPTSAPPRSAVVWNNLIPSALPTLGGEDNFANDVNASGAIVGMSSDPLGRRHAVLWTR